MCKVDAADREEALARTLLRSASMGRRSPRSPSRWAISSGRGRASTSSSRRSTGSRVTGGWRPTGTCPIGSQCRIRLTNSSKEPVTVSAVVSVDRGPTSRGFPHFHARWRFQDDLQTKKADGTLDWPALRVSGSSGPFRRPAPRTSSTPRRPGGARATRRSTSTARASPARSAPAPRITSATPGATTTPT